MPTAGAMVDEMLGMLQSWSQDADQVTTLAASLGASDVAGQVTTSRGVATGLSPGQIEIDRELMYVDSVTPGTPNASFTITPWGRGYRSTTATTHASGAKVTSQPTFPRQKLLDQMNQTINRVFPDIFATGSVELTTTVPQITYALPADAQWVLGIKWLVPDARNYWKSVLRWRVSPGGGTLQGDTGITVDVADMMMPGQPIQFLYAYAPTPMVNESDDFVTTTGMGASLVDVIELGAAAKAVSALELSRLQTSSIEQQNRSQLVAPSAALTSSRFLDQEYQTRLMEERQALQRLYPPRVTREWI